MRNIPGFTLVELMIVIGIIGILAAALFPTITQYVDRAKDASKISNVKTLANAIEARAVDKGSHMINDFGSGTYFAVTNNFTDGLLNYTDDLLPKEVDIYGYYSASLHRYQFASVMNYNPTLTGGEIPIDVLIKEKYLTARDGIPYRYISNSVLNSSLYSVFGFLDAGDILENPSTYAQKINSRKYKNITPAYLVKPDLFIYYYNLNTDSFGIYASLENTMNSKNIENIIRLNHRVEVVGTDYGNMFEYFGLNYAIGK